uniref:Uncharacterized protein n=1 Tax=Populus trichocarpa TaxID=3694 RepID=U5GGB7_POPTR
MVGFACDVDGSPILALNSFAFHIKDAYSQTQPHYSATWLGLGCPCSNLTFEFTSAHQFIVWLILSI